MELVGCEKEMSLSNDRSVEEQLSLASEKDYRAEEATEHVIAKVSKGLEKNIDEAISQEGLSSKKVDSQKVKEIAQTVAETALKLVLKKKLNVNFSTFNEAKEAIKGLMNSDTKAAVKNASDAALDQVKKIDSDTRNAIKSVKNKVLDTFIDNGNHEITVQQTKIINRLGKNCAEFQQALSQNDEKTMKRRITSIRRDLNQVLPIKETIDMAQTSLDQFALWQNKGKEALTKEEVELIQKWDKSA